MMDDVGGDQGADQTPLGIFGILSLILRHGQKLLVYPAGFQRFRPPTIQNPAMIGIPYMAPLLRTSDGVDLSCYLLPQTHRTLSKIREGRYHHLSGSLSLSTSRPIDDVRVELTPAASEAQATVIVFHGNSQHHWEDMQTAKDFFVMRCNVFLLSYRGYSLSSGSPSEKGLRIDAQTALEYVLNQPYLAKTPIILYGHSLGGGVAVDLASRHPSKIASLILSNTFTSVPDIVRRWPFIGRLSFICHEKWNSAKKMRLVPPDTPILILSGRRDEVVHPELVDKLWEAARVRGKGKGGRAGAGAAGVGSKEGEGEKVKRRSRSIFKRRKKTDEAQPDLPPTQDVFVKIEEGTHNQTPNYPEYWAAIEEFIRKSTSAGRYWGGDASHVPIKVSSPRLSSPPKPLDRRWRYVNREIRILNDEDA